MLTFWLAALVIFIIIEAATVAVTSIWFAIGSIGAMIVTILGGKLWLQVIAFFVISVLMLIFTRPLAKKYLNPNRKATNADRVIGTAAVVSELIDNIAGTGAVRAGGKEWTARSLTGAVFSPGEIVRVDHIEGVKLIVKPPREEHPDTFADEL